MKYIKLCKNCQNNRKDDDIWGSGYITWVADDNFECPICKHKLVDTVLTGDEEDELSDITRSASFYDSMIKLKQDNPIEFQLKMAQLKNQVQQQKSVTSSSNKPKCPTCGSTNIRKMGGVERGASIVAFGIFSKKINKTFKCDNCDYTW